MGFSTRPGTLLIHSRGQVGGFDLILILEEEDRSRQDSPTEKKFKLAERLFVSRFNEGKNTSLLGSDLPLNWYSKDYVDELQRFYQRERDTLKDRIDRVYKENDEVKVALLKQIDDLKSQVQRNHERYKEDTIT